MTKRFRVRDKERIDKLPLGHYDRQAYEEAIKTEYAMCRQVEHEWIKRTKLKPLQRYVDWKTATSLIWKLCDAVGNPHIQRVFFDPAKVVPGASAHYCGNQIYFSSQTHIYLTTLVHEVTHHVARNCGHNERFCEMEKFMFEVLDNIMEY